MELAHDETAALDELPTHLCIGTMLKARPSTEGKERYVYVEASNETKDQQNEVVLAKALESSADYYLKFGNLDLEHYTQIGAKAGIPNYEAYEIGRPVAVSVDKGRTFVKGHIRSGTGPAAEQANLFWSSLTDVNPPKRWYPSVGGAITGRDVTIDPLTKAKSSVIHSVRWTNIGFSATPVNPNLEVVSTTPFGPLAKSWQAAIEMSKSLSSGYNTDSATLVGGEALRGAGPQGNDGVLSYWDFRDQFAALIKHGQIREMKLPSMVHEARSRFNLSASDASEYVERFLDDLQRGLKEKRQ